MARRKGNESGHRLVYSTERGAVCSRCGWPTRDCRCAARSDGRGDQAVPERIVARLAVERAGRKGKTVTVVDGLPKNRDFLRQLVGELKRACGSGGATGDGRVEIQGDHRDALRRLLGDKGWTVKG